MTTERSNKDRINNTQRQKLAKLSDQVLSEKMEAAKKADDEYRKDMERRVKDEMGITDMERDIRAAEGVITRLRERLHELSYSRYDGIHPDSRAGRLLARYVAEHASSVDAVREKMLNNNAAIWASTTVSGAMAILEDSKSTEV